MNPTLDNKLVLGFPYAGAFLWLLSAEEYYHKKIFEPYDGSHPYYKTLFGRNHNLVINETISLTLLFAEIYLSPVDSFLPGYRDYRDDKGFYHHKELGVISTFEWEEEVRKLDIQTDILLADNVIANLLESVPKNARELIVLQALNQIHISNKFDAPIFAIPSYLKLCQRISKLINPTGNELKVKDGKLPTTALNKIFEFSSLQFSINGLEEFATLRMSKSILDYGHAFRKHIKQLPNNSFDEKYLLKAMVEAINKDEIADKISGGIALTSTVASAISLIPFIGPVGGAIGLGADLTSRATHKFSAHNKWWLIAPEISKQLSKKRIEEQYKKLKRQ